MMAAATNRVLSFQLAGIGFILDLAHIVEVVEHPGGLLDCGRHDLDQGIVAALDFRRTWIPVVDPALKLKLASASAVQDRAALIVRGSEGNWALLADRVVELVSKERLSSCRIPPLLKMTAGGMYSQVFLFEGVPLVMLEPESFYGTGQDPS